MRHRFPLLALALLGGVACSQDDGVTVNARPPLGGVRFINAVPDGGAVDIRMVDQVEWSASSVAGPNDFGLAFRAGTIHWPTEAKARRIRVFPTDSAIAVTSTVLHDTTITIQADRNITLMLVGSRAAGGRVRFVQIDDNPPTLTGGQIAVRVVNAAGAGQTPATVNGYVLPTTSSALPANATFAGVASNSASAYAVRDTAAFAIRTASPSDMATIFSASAPTGAPAGGGLAATAGALGPGTAMSAYVFPRSTAGTTAPQTAAFTAPAVVFFVDRVPRP